jgi:uncharacterized protein YlxW (UPF0749 family)
MAKALLGHVRGPDPSVLAEVRRLQHQVRDLEAEVARLRKEYDALAAMVSHDTLAPLQR